MYMFVAICAYICTSLCISHGLKVVILEDYSKTILRQILRAHLDTLGMRAMFD